MEDEERAVVGIDPGSASGNMCVLFDSGAYEIISFKDRTLKEWGGYLGVLAMEVKLDAVAEAVHGFPGMSAIAVTSLMRNMGHIEMALALNLIPTRYITPQTWMKYYGVKRDKAETKTMWKKRLREVLHQRLPEAKCTTEQADAVLIALYGRCTRV
jgi:hypothetical protein